MVHIEQKNSKLLRSLHNDLTQARGNIGDPWENRTPDAGVRGRSLNRLTNGPYKSRRLPIFTSRFQLTIFGTSKLNFCVRNGNRWNLTVIVTDQYDWFSITFLFYFVQCFLKDVPSKLNNHCSHFVIDLRIQANCGQALDLLVHTC